MLFAGIVRLITAGARAVLPQTPGPVDALVGVASTGRPTAFVWAGNMAILVVCMEPRPMEHRRSSATVDASDRGDGGDVHRDIDDVRHDLQPVGGQVIVLGGAKARDQSGTGGVSFGCQTEALGPVARAPLAGGPLGAQAVPTSGQRVRFLLSRHLSDTKSDTLQTPQVAP